MDHHSRTCTVTFEHASGKYAHTTMARSVFEAARNALAFFAKPFWKGPRPRADTILEVAVTGSGETYRVRADRVK